MIKKHNYFTAISTVTINISVAVTTIPPPAPLAMINKGNTVLLESAQVKIIMP